MLCLSTLKQIQCRRFLLRTHRRSICWNNNSQNALLGIQQASRIMLILILIKFIIADSKENSRWRTSSSLATNKSDLMSRLKRWHQRTDRSEIHEQPMGIERERELWNMIWRDGEPLQENTASPDDLNSSCCLATSHQVLLLLFHWDVSFFFFFFFCSRSSNRTHGYGNAGGSGDLQTTSRRLAGHPQGEGQQDAGQGGAGGDAQTRHGGEAQQRRQRHAALVPDQRLQPLAELQGDDKEGGF